jgi:hypothetical protein
MKNAARPLSPLGYTNLEDRSESTQNYKGYFVSPDGDSCVEVWLGLEAVFFDEAEESVLVHL